MDEPKLHALSGSLPLRSPVAARCVGIVLALVRIARLRARQASGA